jgi:hypothetical protein
LERGQLVSNDSPLVDCAAPHTAQTFHTTVLPDTAVGELETFWLRDETPAADEAQPQRGGALETLSDECATAFAAYLGWNEPMIPHRFGYYWFTPSRQAWAGGDRTGRCDIHYPAFTNHPGRPTTYRDVDLPEADMAGYLTRLQAVAWGRCIRATEPHTYRTSSCRHRDALVTVATRQLKDGPYPGDEEMTTRVTRWCREQVPSHAIDPANWSSKGFFAHEDAWRKGSRYQTCALATFDWDGAPI